MSNDLRITGDWPSPDILKRFPNWENAYDEEGVDGQDETTLRPSEDQSVIGEYVPFTAGAVWLNNGQECPAIIELLDGLAGVDLHLSGQWYRLVRFVDRFGQFERWEPYIEDWLPEKERCPSLSLSNEEVSPLHLASCLPYYRTSMPIKATILPDGGEETAR